MSLQISMALNILSLVFGGCAWVFGYLAIAMPRQSAAYRWSVASFSACAISLVLQLFEVGNRAGIGDFSAIADTIRAVLIAGVTLIVVTMVLNVIALLKKRTK